jgi:hypothetical protein
MGAGTTGGATDGHRWTQMTTGTTTGGTADERRLTPMVFSPPDGMTGGATNWHKVAQMARFGGDVGVGGSLGWGWG